LRGLTGFRLLLAAALLGSIFCSACASSSGHIPKPPSGSVGVAGGYAIEFHQRTETFYTTLIRRRFNTLETFNDRVLRDHFQTPDAFFDYYADLAQSLNEARFERSRPTDVHVEELLFENRFIAQVQVRFVGKNSRPLNPGRSVLIRLDRWERIDGRWWIRPGKL
jgi:hypothetical protein